MKTRILSIFFFTKPNELKYFLIISSYCVLILLIGIPGFLLQRILSPVIRFRVCIFPTNYIGHMIYEFENYYNFQTESDSRLNFDLFCTQPNISNKYLFNKIKKNLRFFPRFLIIPIYLVNRMFPGGKFTIRLSESYILSTASEIYTRPKKFFFTKQEIEIGDNLLEQIGWDPSKKLITLFLRTIDFRRNHLKESNANETLFRDVKLESYAGLITKLRNSYMVQQMGTDSSYFIYTKFSKQEIEFLNIYAVYRSSICITTDSGSSLIPFMFRVPTIQTNVSLTSILQGAPGKLVLPLVYYDLVSGRKIPLSELINRKIYMVTENSKFKILGIGIIQASFSELEDLNEEIKEVMNGEWTLNQINYDFKSAIVRKYESNFPNIRHINYANNWILKNSWYLQ
jgi:putative glycosyltransferase (TIGR04372 family)